MTLSSPIPLPFAADSVAEVLAWGASPDSAPYSHKQIAEWCDAFWCRYLDVDAPVEIERLLPLLTNGAEVTPVAEDELQVHHNDSSHQAACAEHPMMKRHSISPVISRCGIAEIGLLPGLVMHHMQAFRLFIVSFILSVTLGSACAQEGNPAFIYLMPYAQIASSCAEDSGVDLAKLRESVEAAGRTASSIVSKDTWALVSSGLVPSERQPPNPAAQEACKHFMESLRAPDFATQLRQTIAAQGVSVLALTCLVHYPAEVPTMKADWIAAFQRLGFSIDASTLDKFIEAATPKDPQSSLSPHFPIKAETCKDVAKTLFGPNFDAQYGEEGIRKLFVGR